jgi:hypothetical protein
VASASLPGGPASAAPGAAAEPRENISLMAVSSNISGANLASKQLGAHIIFFLNTRQTRLTFLPTGVGAGVALATGEQQRRVGDV